MRAIADKPTLTEADEAEVEALSAEFESEQIAFSRSQAQAKPLDKDPLGQPRSHTRYRAPWELQKHDWGWRQASPKELRSRALSAVEVLDGANDADRQRMTETLEEFDDSHGSLSRIALLTSDPDYLRAFGEMAQTGGQNPILSEAEVQAVRRVKSEARAAGLTDNAGGFLIPFQLDPAIVITSDGSFNPFRRVARRVVATGDVWSGVSAAATSWSWDAEAEEVSDDASTIAQPSITIHKAQGFIPFSLEIGEDGANFTEEMRRLLAFGRDTLEETAFATGSGTGEPFGIVTALNAVGGSIVSTATSGQFGSVDIYAVDEDLPARYRQGPRAAWFANRAIWNDVDVFETSNGSKLFEGVVGNPGTLLGSPTYEAEAMDSTIASTDDYVLVYGDFDNYVIADRSSAVEFIPHLLARVQAGPPANEACLLTSV
jgi:HK97 family phage major capsid protein